MTAAEMTFGVEIECSIPHEALRQSGWRIGGYHHGALISEFAAFGWNVQSDASVRPARGCTSVEIVSGVLKGVEGLASVKAMVERLNAMGAKVNSSCGFHVHVGFDGDAAAMARLIHLTANVEPALRASTGSVARDHSHYCASIKEAFGGVKGQSPASLDEIRRHYAIAANRYHVLNLTNILGGRRPAVEFRVFSGTLNFAKMAGYIQICLGLVQRAIEVKRTAEWDAKPVTEWIRQSQGGQFQGELFRLFQLLGWKSNFKQEPRGIVMQDTIAPAMQVLKKMAAKYDAARGTATEGQVTAARTAARGIAE